MLYVTKRKLIDGPFCVLGGKKFEKNYGKRRKVLYVTKRKLIDGPFCVSDRKKFEKV